MKAIQRSLQFPVAPGRALSKEERERERKHGLILGRPRRLRATFPPLSGDDWKVIDQRLDAGMSAEEAVADFAKLPEVIKIALPPKVVEILDRIRTRMAGSATRPDLVRMAVTMFVRRNEHLIGGPSSPDRQKRKAEEGRCNYVKIPFEPEIAEKIGHQEWIEDLGVVETDRSGLPLSKEIRPHLATGLCAVFGLTRQQIIARAIEEFLREMR